MAKQTVECKEICEDCLEYIEDCICYKFEDCMECGGSPCMCRQLACRCGAWNKDGLPVADCICGT